MNINPQPILTVGGELHIVDAGDGDDGPLARITWQNEWHARWMNLNDDERLRLGAAIRDAILSAKDVP